MHKLATTRIYFVLCALLTLPVFGCGDDGKKDPRRTPGRREAAAVAAVVPRRASCSRTARRYQRRPASTTAT